MNDWASIAPPARAPVTTDRCAATRCALEPTVGDLCGAHAGTVADAAECGACAFETSEDSERIGGIDLDPSAHTDHCQSAALLGIHPRWHRVRTAAQENPTTGSEAPHLGARAQSVLDRNRGGGMIGGRIAPEELDAVMERWRWTCDCGASDYAHRADDCAADLLDHLAGSHYTSVDPAETRWEAS